MSNPYTNIRRVPDRGRSIDMQEVLKKEIYRQTPGEGSALSVASNSSFSINSNGVVTPGATPGGPVTSTFGFEDWQFYFDSIAKNGTSNTSGGELIWSISNINNNQDVKNIIEAHVDSFYFPRLQIDDVHPDYFYYRKLFMQIENAPSAQSINAQAGFRFHFEFDVDNLNSTAVLLTPVKRSFFFQRPITSFTEFDVRFIVPQGNTLNGFQYVNLPPDIITIQSAAGNQMTLLGGPTTQQAFGPVLPATTPPVFPYTLPTQVAVYITGFPGGTSTYAVGTAGTANVPSTTVTGAGTTWIPAYANFGTIVFANGAQASIIAVVSTTQLTVSPAVTVPNGTAYTIYYGSLGVINDTGGIFVDTLQSNTNFTIQVFNPTTGAYVAGTFPPNLTATMVIAKNRIAFPFMFTCVLNQITNYITVSHE